MFFAPGRTSTWVSVRSFNGAHPLLLGLAWRKSFSRTVLVFYLYCRDLKNKDYYIFDKNGKYLGTFGKPGEVPGEVKQIGQASLALVGDKVLIVDNSQILYFDAEGKFLRSVLNNGQSRNPVVFLN
jgi:hypothetical protein